MIVLVKDIPAYAFSSGLNELVFATDQNKAVLSLTVGEKEILVRNLHSGCFWPDNHQ